MSGAKLRLGGFLEELKRSFPLSEMGKNPEDCLKGKKSRKNYPHSGLFLYFFNLRYSHNLINYFKFCLYKRQLVT